MLLALRVFTPRELEILRGVYVSFRLPGSARLSRRAATDVSVERMAIGIRTDGESTT
jgi:hypothetical protein